MVNRIDTASTGAKTSSLRRASTAGLKVRSVAPVLAAAAAAFCRKTSSAADWVDSVARASAAAASAAGSGFLRSGRSP